MAGFNAPNDKLRVTVRRWLLLVPMRFNRTFRATIPRSKQLPLLWLLLRLQFCGRLRKRWQNGDEFAQPAVKSLGEFESEEIVWGVREDEGREARVQPLGNDGSPFVNPRLDKVQVVSADEAQQRMPAGHGAAEWRTRLAALRFGFGGGGRWSGEQGTPLSQLWLAR